VSPQFPDLRKSLDDYIARAKRDGTLARLVARYLPDGSQFQRIDASALHADIGNELPNWRALFHDAQERTGVEWRLLAAIAYQESKWDPAAQSETGARGLMQITEETAKHLGIADRTDPRTNLLGAARLPARPESQASRPDRGTRSHVAGACRVQHRMAHLEDARILAQKQRLSPDLWNDVRQVLPLLAQPEYYNDAKYGYARGGMPVAFVDRVRGYYDILLARQPPFTPRLRATAP
jgi:membrane-bound lytic murein transglycosylase F